MRKFLTIGVLLLALLAGCGRPLVRPYYPRLSVQALDEEIRRVATSGWSNQQKMVYYSWARRTTCTVRATVPMPGTTGALSSTSRS